MDINTLIKIRQSLIDKGADADTIKMMDEAIENAREKQNMSDQEIEESSKKASEAAKKQSEDVVKSNNRTIASQRETTAAVAETARQLGVSEEAIQRFVEEQERMADGAASATAQLEAQARKMGMNKKMTDSFTGSLIQAGSLGFAALAESMKNMLTPQALFASGLAQMETATKQLFNAFDQQQAQLSRATATTGEYNDMLYDVQESNRAFGVDVEAAGEAIAGLHTELSTFNQMSEVQQKQLTTTTARLKALGVEGTVAAQTFDNMIQGMGMSANMANDAQLEMVALGSAIGVSAEIISKDFNQAAQELSKYGAEAITVFKGLSAAAKATGIEMQSLISITSGMDTFEGAAQSAGKLNAILGGGVLNSMDLLNANEEERIRMLIESMALSGKNFELLNKHEKLAIANAAGIKDMTQANKLFSMSLSAYDEMQSKASAASAEQAKLEERAQAAITFAEKLKQIGQAFAVAFMPVLEFAHGFANIILELNDMTGGIFIPAMLAATGVLFFLGGGFKSLAASFVSTATTAPPAATGLQAINLALAQTAFILVPMVPVLTAAALAFASIGFAVAGIGMAFAAPFLALSAVATTIKEVFVAMIEAPDAILAATAGLLGFAIAGALSMQILALGLAGVIMILTPFTAQMALLAGPLMRFGFALAVAVVPFYLMGKALESLAAGIQAFNNVGAGSLVMAAVSLALFAAMLVPISAQLGVSSIVVGVAAMLLGKGLVALAEGVVEFNDVGFGALTMAIITLAAFAKGLTFVATQLAVAGVGVGIALILLGKGLKSFAIGLQEFNNVGGMAIVKAISLLALLGATLPFVTVQLFLAGTGVGIALGVLGDGLLSFAKGLRKFNRLGVEAILIAMGALGGMALLLPHIGTRLAIAALTVGIPLILLGKGLYEFARGLRKFNKIGVTEIGIALLSLIGMTVALKPIGFMLAKVFTLVSLPLIAFGNGLLDFANGIRRFNAVGFEAIAKAVLSLVGLALALKLASPMFLGMLLVGTALIAFGMGLQEFGRGIRRFNNVGVAAIAMALVSLAAFAAGMTLIAPMMVPMGKAMAIAAIPLMAFGYALGMLGDGLRKIARNVGALFDLGKAVFTLASVGAVGLFAMGAVGAGISSIASALEEIPTEKAIAFSMTADGYSKMLAQVNQLQPESVASAEELVGIAQEYAEIQAEMRMPEADAFVQAMRQYFGLDADGNQAGGQDIVLKLNNREFARAVDAAINKAHNLRID